MQEDIIRQSQESVEKDFQDNLKNTYEIVADIYKLRNNVLNMYVREQKWKEKECKEKGEKRRNIKRKQLKGIGL